MLGRCCVFQPFDHGGPFDKRYDDGFDPAIKAADLDPYRVDRDHKAEIPMDSLHDEIRESVACLADISTDNPNVWYELGYALASGKPVVMVCAKGRKYRLMFSTAR
jgi:nucleoside 2-deoxyribosyltransferase